MSLIMDALEKVQREARPPLTGAAEWPVMDRPKPAAAAVPAETFAKIPLEEAAPDDRRRLFWVVLVFAVLLFAAAVLGFQKISAGLSLPQVPGSSMPTLTARAVGSAVKPQAGPGLLRGVLQDPAGSFCILGDQILKTGDTWRGYTVVSIEAQQVVVQDTQNRLLTLHLQES